MTMVDVTFIKQGLLGFDTYVAPQGPPERTLGSLELVNVHSWGPWRQFGANSVFVRAYETSERMMETAQYLDVQAALGREAADVDERRERLGNIDCVLPSLLADLAMLQADVDAVEAAVNAQDPAHPQLVNVRLLRAALAPTEERLAYLEAVEGMQWAACDP